MKVKVKKLSENAKLPIKIHKEDFCYDVYATSCEEIEPGIWKYGIGLAFEIVRDDLELGSWTADSGMVKYDDGKFKSVMCSKGFSVCERYYSNLQISIDFRPRSSIWKTGLVLSNCVGTIDELYRGEVLAYFYEVVPGKEKYKVGDRIGQIKLGFTLPINWEVVDELNMKTERGTDGFGSTGK